MCSSRSSSYVSPFFLRRRFARNVLCYEDEVTQESLERHTIPQTLHQSVDPPRAYPTPTSIAGVLGDYSRHKVTCCFQIASQCWPGAGGSRGRQRGHRCRGTPIVSETIPLGRSCSNCARPL